MVCFIVDRECAETLCHVAGDAVRQLRLYHLEFNVILTFSINYFGNQSRCISNLHKIKNLGKMP